MYINYLQILIFLEHSVSIYEHLIKYLLLLFCLQLPSVKMISFSNYTPDDLVMFNDSANSFGKEAKKNCSDGNVKS